MSRTVHIVSHTHWDREWYQTFQQFRLKLVHLVDALLGILETDPEFMHFMLDGQTIVLDDYLHMRPEKEDLLRSHVQSGRILIGPWHILPDMFLVSPEAHIRNLLQGARTARRFGPKMSVGYIPDPFGHPGQIPQILRGFDISQAVLWRGVPDLPCELWWQSPDGSRVLLAHLRESYGNGAALPAQDPALFASQLRQACDALAAHAAASDLLVMYGTDHMEPSAHTSNAIRQAADSMEDGRVLHSTLPGYLAAVAGQLAPEKIPIINGELRACSRSPLLPGVLSSRMWIKQRNRACETLLEKWAEPFSVFAGRAVVKPPGLLNETGPLLRQAWRLLMENHPHDSICGCSIDQVHVEMRPRFDQVDQIGEEIIRQSLLALAGQVETERPGAAAALVVFNPTGALRCEVVQAELKLPEEIQGFEILDDTGAILPHEQRGSQEQEVANILLAKEAMLDMIGNIHEGRVAGMAILKISLVRSGNTVSVEAVLDEHAQPDRAAWRQAEHEIAALKADPGVTHVQVRARTPRASQIAFLARDVPAHGWRTFWVRPAQAQSLPAPAVINPLVKALLPVGMRFAASPLGSRLLARLSRPKAQKPPYVIENEYLRVEASPADGTLTLTDLRSGAVFSGLNRFVDGGDAGDEYNYSPPAADALLTPAVVSIHSYPGALPAALEIRLRLRTPARLEPDRQSRARSLADMPILTRVMLAPGASRLEIHTEIENCAEDHRLRVHFPAPFRVESADYDGHFEVVRRPIGVPLKDSGWVEDPRPEAPQRAFTSIASGSTGLMIASRGLPEVEVINAASGAEIALTLLRCVGWLSRDDLAVRLGHAGPGMPTPGAQMPGVWSFDYAVIPHVNNLLDASMEAYAFEAQMRTAAVGLQAGALSPVGSFITVEPPAFVISAVKDADDGDGWIVRGINLFGDAIQVRMRLALPYSAVWLANMAEEPHQQLALDAVGAFVFSARGHEVITLLIR